MGTGFLGNIAVTLGAKGSSAVLCTLIICITLLGIFGRTPDAGFALGVLSAALGMFGMTLAQIA